ncbi:cupin domain-containing protein [Asticcacaulis sp. 201]|uniref:cupin domain-containing protein n=1 Tax=Asticcacaulis sp. 201 TaxID=3028787 RepID=UPI0029162782|nr:cupin domain-containing protein [Asticcacaulis sp. 201]MDV6330783.1 cupin domain-containing protein [Asticcacaulis sp. 201]
MDRTNIYLDADAFIPGIHSLSSFSLRLEPNEARDLCWHSRAEFGMVVAGKMTLTGVDRTGQPVSEILHPGDTWFFPTGAPHWVQGLSDGCDFIVCCDALFEAMPVAGAGTA